MRGLTIRLDRLEDSLEHGGRRRGDGLVHRRRVETRAGRAERLQSWHQAAVVARCGRTCGSRGRSSRRDAADEPLRGPDPGASQRAAQPMELSLDTLRRAWSIILNAVKRQRPGFAATLAEGRPESLEGDLLVIKFPQGMDFQASQVGQPGQRRGARGCPAADHQAADLRSPGPRGRSFRLAKRPKKRSMLES